MDSLQPFEFQVPETIGLFRILQPLGEGGMGAVFLGQRMEQFSQQVAIKILHPHLFPQTAVAAIEREGQILTILDHPGIVRMLDRNISESGLRYIVMEYVEGLPLDQFCDQHRLPIRDRIEILLKVLDAVEFAHRHLVVHADLKPANILITSDKQPKLLDFGVAAILSEQAETNQSTDENFGSMTALYASPEQQAGERLTVASDLFSLGVIAQIVLTGVAPKRALIAGEQSAERGRTRVSLPRELKALDADEIRSIVDSRNTTLKDLGSAIEGDLEAILAKALQVDPQQRFQSAQEMSGDLQRYLLGYPVHSHPISLGLRSWKWILRNKVAAALAFVFLLVSIASAIGVIAQATHAARQREIAQTRLRDLVRLTDVLAGELYDSVHGLPGSESAQAALLTNAHQTIDALTRDSGQDPQLGMELANEYEKLARLDMNSVPRSQLAEQRSIDDLNRGLAILNRLAASHPIDAESLSKRIQEMARLRDSIVTERVFSGR
jgi:predicted Ser/Thr protein kinase